MTDERDRQDHDDGPKFARVGELDDLALLPGNLRRIEVELKTDLALVKERQRVAAERDDALADRLGVVEEMLCRVDAKLDKVLARSVRGEQIADAAQKQRHKRKAT